ncbi:MAG: hypothetical protein J1D87_00885 [Lachnospiraceae bacterium]|nr:hypothetical protein [Lachnospiraceae bacterium]
MLKEILILFVPGAVGVILYRYLEKIKWSIWSYIENYSLFVLLIYFLARTIFYLSGLQEFSIRELDLAVQLKFGILSMVLAAALAFIFHYRKVIWTYMFKWRKRHEADNTNSML